MKETGRMILNLQSYLCGINLYIRHILYSKDILSRVSSELCVYLLYHACLVLYHLHLLSFVYTYFSSHFFLSYDFFISPFLGSMLNFLRPIDICLSLLECLSSGTSSASISETTSQSSSLICCKGKKERRKLNSVWTFTGEGRSLCMHSCNWSQHTFTHSMGIPKYTINR